MASKAIKHMIENLKEDIFFDEIEFEKEQKR